MAKVLKMGTRRSLLAKAQSGWVAREIEKLNPGLTIETVGIDTRGDKILDVSLQSIEGKEFFIAELDDALRSGHVDFTVHSMKDLSLERPADFKMISVPRRENPRDVVLFGPGILQKLREIQKGSGQKIKIGTSSPRRLENAPGFLEQALPFPVSKDQKRLEFIDIRGNVNTRLGRVHEPSDHPKHLDAVILAFAGLIRLWRDPEARVEMAKLFAGVKWMVLPVKECPSAPAQGALAIECRAKDLEVQEVLKRVSDPSSLSQVSMERQILADWGGGCHQKFGATAVHHQEFGDILYIRGRKPDGVFVDEARFKCKVPSPDQLKAWDGTEFTGKYQSLQLDPKSLSLGPALFVAHSRAVTEGLNEVLLQKRVWTSGVKSWFKLAQKNIWVEGCAEGLGFEGIESMLNEAVLGLPKIDQWSVLTHDLAVDSWNGPKIVATYKVLDPDLTPEQIKQIQSATHFYWNSGSQFQKLKKFVPQNAVHSCGAGKTSEYLKQKHHVSAIVFPSVKEWQRWLKI